MHEEQINLDLISENVRLKERINVLEARYSREQGRSSAQMEAINVLKEIAQTLGAKGLDYLTELTAVSLKRDQLIKAGTELFETMLRLSKNRTALAKEEDFREAWLAWTTLTTE